MTTNATTMEKQQISLAQAMQEHDAEIEKNVLYVRLLDGESKRLKLTGNINKTKDKFERTMLEFELQDTVEDGAHKSISFNIKNPIVKPILQRIKEGKNDLVIHRTGNSNSDTKYSLIELA
ncbi:MAG: hypothetical protein KGI06_01330 [Candidatus Micrarchaeota archaeon]|nr:hypothetical protein [Candidatus Micrarchaeota archaeon]